MKKINIVLLILVSFLIQLWTALGDELILAVMDGDMPEVEKLLIAGADINFQDDIGYTALMEAYTSISKG